MNEQITSAGPSGISSAMEALYPSTVRVSESEYIRVEASLRRWLATHDAEVKAEALREAADSLLQPLLGNAPYWLRWRADRIEREARP